MKGWILLAAGGTGGHLFPAEALAHELRRRGWKIHLATDDRAERFAAGFPADETSIISSATLAGRNPLALARALWTIWRGARESARLIARIRPSAVVGFGGYPTVPPLWAATRRGIPAAIHEQNAVMGRANRALSRRVNLIAGGFLKPGGPHAGKIVITGNPVRPDVLAAADRPYAEPDAAGEFRLLVFGGSQGARFFAEVLPEALARLPLGARQRLKVTLQVRNEDEDGARKAFAELGVKAEIAAFFTDMAERIRDAHLIVARSGASTVSEIAAIGRPSLLVPYPHALDHDQAANAEALAATGGARVALQRDLTAESLAASLSEWMANPATLAAMAGAARRAGKPQAARLLADAVEAIASDRIARPAATGEGS